MTLDVSSLSAQIGIPLWAIALATIWTMIWKGLALWKSARASHTVWFVIFIVINTLGILEILYIFLFSKINLSEFDNKPIIRKTRKNRKKI